MKNELILLSIIAIALAVLTSCRPPKIVETERQSTEIHNVLATDSLHHGITLMFDRLDAWIFDSVETDSLGAPRPSVKHGAKHLMITNFVACDQQTHLRRQSQTDSIATDIQEVIHPTRQRPKRCAILGGILLLLLAVLFPINYFLKTKGRT